MFPLQIHLLFQIRVEVSRDCLVFKCNFSDFTTLNKWLDLADTKGSLAFMKIGASCFKSFI